MAPRSWLVRSLLLAAAYYVVGRVALLARDSAGLRDRGVASRGRGVGGTARIRVPGLAGRPAGIVLINLPTALANGEAGLSWQPAMLALTLGAGASLQALAGAWLVRRVVGYPVALAGQMQVGTLLVLGGPVACIDECQHRRVQPVACRCDRIGGYRFQLVDLVGRGQHRRAGVHAAVPGMDRASGVSLAARKMVHQRSDRGPARRGDRHVRAGPCARTATHVAGVGRARGRDAVHGAFERLPAGRGRSPGDGRERGAPAHRRTGSKQPRVAGKRAAHWRYPRQRLRRLHRHRCRQPHPRMERPGGTPVRLAARAGARNAPDRQHHSDAASAGACSRDAALPGDRDRRAAEPLDGDHRPASRWPAISGRSEAVGAPVRAWRAAIPRLRA